MTVTRRIRRRGEHEISRKTIACGNAGCSGGPVVATLVCHHHTLRTRLRVQRAPGIPHALCWAKDSCTARAHRAAGSRRCGYHVPGRERHERSEIVRCVAPRTPEGASHHILHKYQACTASPWPFRADVLSREHIFSTATQTDRTPPDRLRRWRFFAHELFVLQRKDRLRA